MGLSCLLYVVFQFLHPSRVTIAKFLRSRYKSYHTWSTRWQLFILVTVDPLTFIFNLPASVDSPDPVLAGLTISLADSRAVRFAGISTTFLQRTVRKLIVQYSPLPVETLESVWLYVGSSCLTKQPYPFSGSNRHQGVDTGQHWKAPTVVFPGLHSKLEWS